MAYQLLEGGLLQVALQGEVAEAFPGRLVGLDLHRVALHGGVVSDGTASHQRGARQALQILRGNTTDIRLGKVEFFSPPCVTKTSACRDDEKKERLDLRLNIRGIFTHFICTTTNR